MKRMASPLIAGLTICALMVCLGSVGYGQTLLKTRTPMKIDVKANEKTVVFELNDSQAARDLYAQLPLRIKVENYGSNEKIFYPPKKLRTADAPAAAAQAGTLAYYAPWGDVVMFYDRFDPAPGLYELGRAVSGGEHIPGMSGTIQIEHRK